MKKGAIVCASGIGDGLLMMIGAHHLKQAGLTPTVFHDRSVDLAPLFPVHILLPHLPFEELEEGLQKYERVIVENDHSSRACHLFRLREQGRLPHLTFFFPTPSKMIRAGDILFNPKIPFASNLAEACRQLLGTALTKNNDLNLPVQKVYRKYPSRIVIHPTSQDRGRNWSKKQFLTLAEQLKKKGFSVTFCVSPKERREWEKIEGIFLPTFHTLSEVRDYLYESGFFIGNDSGMGHLASNVGLPTLTISGNPKRVFLWRPNWSMGKVVTLPFPLPNFKGIGLPIREKYWQPFVSVSRVLHCFMELFDASSCYSL